MFVRCVRGKTKPLIWTLFFVVVAATHAFGMRLGGFHAVFGTHRQISHSKICLSEIDLAPTSAPPPPRISYALFDSGALCHQCASMMVQSLASNLAMVTCKDPLKLCMVNQLRGLFYSKWGQPPERQAQEQVQQVCELIARDNVEIGVALVKKRATEEATREIENSLKQAMDDRRKARETGQPYLPRSAGHPSLSLLVPFLAGIRDGYKSDVNLRVGVGGGGSDDEMTK